AEDRQRPLLVQGAPRDAVPHGDVVGVERLDGGGVPGLDGGEQLVGDGEHPGIGHGRTLRARGQARVGVKATGSRLRPPTKGTPMASSGTGSPVVWMSGNLV